MKGKTSNSNLLLLLWCLIDLVQLISIQIIKDIILNLIPTHLQQVNITILLHLIHTILIHLSLTIKLLIMYVKLTQVKVSNHKVITVLFKEKILNMELKSKYSCNLKCILDSLVIRSMLTFINKMDRIHINFKELNFLMNSMIKMDRWYRNQYLHLKQFSKILKKSLTVHLIIQNHLPKTMDHRTRILKRIPNQNLRKDLNIL